MSLNRRCSTVYSTVLIWINRLFGVACTFVLQIHLNKSVRYSFFVFFTFFILFLLRWRDALFHKCTVKIVESQTSIILQQRIYKHSFWLSKSIHTNVKVHVRYIIKIKLIKLNSLNICCLFINIMSRLSIAQFFFYLKTCCCCSTYELNWSFVLKDYSTQKMLLFFTQ